MAADQGDSELIKKLRTECNKQEDKLQQMLLCLTDMQARLGKLMDSAKQQDQRDHNEAGAGLE